MAVQARVHIPPRLLRWFTIVSIPVIGLAVLWLTYEISPGRKENFVWMRGMLPLHVACAASIPVAFLVWVYAQECRQTFSDYFSVRAYSAGVLGFAAVMVFSYWPVAAIVLTLLATLISLFIFVDFYECRRRMAASPRMTIIAAIAIFSSLMYKLSFVLLWDKICRSTGFVIYWMLNAVGVESGISFSEKAKEIERFMPDDTLQIVQVMSQHVIITIGPYCSGLEGVWLFFFMLSAVLLVDWPLFGKWRLLEMYLLGFIYMFLVNALRIASLFLMTHWSRQQEVSGVARLLAEDQLDMFHSYMGWGYYLAAFAVFMAIAYRMAAADKRKMS